METTPASWPAKAVDNDEFGTFNDATSTVEIAPTTLSFFCRPYPTTTTSSIFSVSSDKVTLISFWFRIAISWVVIPKYEKTRTPPASSIVMIYFPSTSVVTPTVLFFNQTLTPGSGKLSLSTTVPVIIFFTCWGRFVPRILDDFCVGMNDPLVTASKSYSATWLIFPSCWEKAFLGFPATGSAYALMGSAIAPATRIKLTGLKLLSIINEFS